MRPAEVDYKRAHDLIETRQLLRSSTGARILAGGQGLLRDLRGRVDNPDLLLDISRVRELNYISRVGDVLEIGAVTTLATVAANDEVRASCPALAEAARRVGDVQVRNRGTVAGNVCGQWSPAGWSCDIGTVLTASGGQLVVVNADGERTVDAVDFTASRAYPLAPDDVIVALRFGLASGSAYHRLSRRWADATIGAAAAFVDDHGSSRPRVRVAVGRIHERVVRLTGVEIAVAAHGLDADEVDEALDVALAGFTLVDSVHADANYRREVFPVIVRRAIAAAAGNAATAMQGGNR